VLTNAVVHQLISKGTTMLLLGGNSKKWAVDILTQNDGIKDWHILTLPYFTSAEDAVWDNGPRSRRVQMQRQLQLTILHPRPLRPGTLPAYISTDLPASASLIRTLAEEVGVASGTSGRHHCGHRTTGTYR
jgi:hypothetical protein